MKRKIIAAVGFAMAAAHFGTSFALTQGDLELGSTGSTGDLDVTFVVPALVRVTVENDVTFSPSPGSDSNEVADGGHFCVYTNQASSDVDIAISFLNDSTASTNTVMTNGGGDELIYTVDLNLDDETPIQAGLLDTGYTINDSADGYNATFNSTCNGNYTHDLDFTVTSANFEAVPADTYTDTITIVATVD